ncbi:hypothetical protein [Streptacidiphilus monticola]|uniref:Uncharacterized protein n=1 Tax=Streptacidiphilus monticola TaxID=2161674 RepID=A0ABW1G2U6_9ACTN
MDQEHELSDLWEHPAPACQECSRLREQARAALLSGDMSRLTDVRVMRNRHRQAEHGQAA